MISRKRKSLRLFSHKKGNVFVDTAVLVVVLFIFAVVGLFSKYAFDEVKDDIDSTMNLSNTTQEFIDDYHGRFPAWMDGAVLFIVVMLWFMVIVASFFIDSHPLFFAISILVLAVVIFVGMSFSNVWDELASQPETSSIAADLPITNFVMSNLGLHTLIVGITIAFVLYAKIRT